MLHLTKGDESIRVFEYLEERNVYAEISWNGFWYNDIMCFLKKEEGCARLLTENGSKAFVCVEIKAAVPENVLGFMELGEAVEKVRAFFEEKGLWAYPNLLRIYAWSENKDGFLGTDIHKGSEEEQRHRKEWAERMGNEENRKRIMDASIELADGNIWQETMGRKKAQEKRRRRLFNILEKGEKSS